ncbi:MAG: RNA polymerase sigma factor [Planctomycetota bacterium]
MPVGAEREESLAAQAAAGDRVAGGELLALVRPELAVFLRLHGAHRIRSRESIDDVVQSVFGECLLALPSFTSRGPGSFRGWLRCLALRKLLDKHRYHGAQARDLGRDEPTGGTRLEPFADSLHQLPSPSQAAIGREAAERLERALAALPEDQRQVVTMARLFAMPHAEIAVVLGKSEPACRMLLSRGMVRLSALMEHWTTGDPAAQDPRPGGGD